MGHALSYVYCYTLKGFHFRSLKQGSLGSGEMGAYIQVQRESLASSITTAPAAVLQVSVQPFIKW